MDDFPGNHFVHRGEPCSGTPAHKLQDFGPSGEARCLEVSCETCDERRNTADFRLSAASLPACWRFPAIEQAVIVMRLREARALIGFTNLDAGIELAESESGMNIRNAPLARQHPA